MVARHNWRWLQQGGRVWKWLKPVLELALLGLALVLLLVAYGILPNRWYQTLYVYSGSMAPTIQAGDVILITPPPADLQPGMIVTLQVDGHLVTHRLLALQANGKFSTRGDANLWVDEWGGANVKVVGLYRARLPYLGYILGGLQNFLRVNSSGAWFVDQERLAWQVQVGSPTETETEVPCANAAGLLTATPTFLPETPLQASAQTLLATSSPTPTLAAEASEFATQTATPEPVSPEVTLAPTLEPTATEPPVAPTQVPDEAGAEGSEPEAAATEAPPAASQP